MLNETFGPEWVRVDEVEVFTGKEIIKFNDGLIYKGFEADDEKRYSSSIVKFDLKKLMF